MTAGLRERKKAEKSTAILQAARELFTTRGYEATKLRDVAALADVGFGTVFSYSKDKHGLLSMLIVDDLRRLPPPFAESDPAAGMLDRVTGCLMKLYEFWAKVPALSRVVLPQMEFPHDNPYSREIIARRRQIRVEIADWFRDRQAEDLVRADADAAQAADTVFAIYTSCLREWIGSEEFNLAAGRERLRRLLELPLRAICGGDGQADPAAERR